MTIFSDSKATLQIAVILVYHESTKYIEKDYHFVREKIQQGLIKTQYISTYDQPADAFTKGLRFNINILCPNLALIC